MLFSLFIVTLLLTLAAPLFQIESGKNLPVPAWLPNKNISNFVFWQFYQFQSISLTIVDFTAISIECLFAAILTIACEHLDILGHRLISIPEYIKSAKNNNISALELSDLEKKLFINCIKDHQDIYS